MVQSIITYRLPVERSDETIAIAIFRGGDWCLGFDNGVDPTDCDFVSMLLKCPDDGTHLD